MQMGLVPPFFKNSCVIKLLRKHNIEGSVNNFQFISGSYILKESMPCHADNYYCKPLMLQVVPNIVTRERLNVHLASVTNAQSVTSFNHHFIPSECL